MPLSPLLNTGHYDPPQGNLWAVIKVVQNSAVTAWGWTETTANPALRQEYWVLGPSYINPVNTQAAFTFDSSGFPGGPPVTRSQFFQRLTTAWGGQQGVQTCAGPATAMTALPSGFAGSQTKMHSLQVYNGTTEIFSGNNTLVGYLFTDPTTRIESLVSYSSMVGPGLPLTLKPCQTQYQSPAEYFAAMTTFLQSHGPPQRYESIVNTWYDGVHTM